VNPIIQKAIGYIERYGDIRDAICDGEKQLRPSAEILDTIKKIMDKGRVV